MLILFSQEVCKGILRKKLFLFFKLLTSMNENRCVKRIDGIEDHMGECWHDISVELGKSYKRKEVV